MNALFCRIHRQYLFLSSIASVAIIFNMETIPTGVWQMFIRSVVYGA